MNTTNTKQNANCTTTSFQTAGVTVPFEAINEPGSYICNWTGHLMRVPADGISPGRSPLINIVGQDALMVTKISDNPFIPLTKARLLASNFDIDVNF